MKAMGQPCRGLLGDCWDERITLAPETIDTRQCLMARHCTIAMSVPSLFNQGDTLSRLALLPLEV